MLGVNERRTAECHAYFSDENKKKCSCTKRLKIKKQFKYTLFPITLIRNRQYRKYWNKLDHREVKCDK